MSVHDVAYVLANYLLLQFQQFQRLPWYPRLKILAYGLKILGAFTLSI